MAITITRAEVKRKCMISSADTTYDADIDALITEMQPGIEYTIDDVYLNNTGDVKLQATLKLGILEILSGETIQQIGRELGASETFSAAGISIGSRSEHGPRLITQGTARLIPYLKVASTSDEAAIQSSSSDTDPSFSNDSMKVW